MTNVQNIADRVSTKNASEKRVLPPLLKEFRQALEEEIDVIEKNGLSSTLLRKGRTVKSDANSKWYEFTVDYMPVLPADTPCKLIVGKDIYEVRRSELREQSTYMQRSRILRLLYSGSEIDSAAGNHLLPIHDGKQTVSDSARYD